MGLRFRKSIRLAPGIRMNLSGSGLSCSIGPRGASVTVGKRGTYVNAGIPGTGLYSRQRIDGPSQSQSNRSSNRVTTNVSITVGVKDDGTIYFNDQDGIPLDEKYIAAAKRQQGDVIKNLIQKKCDEINLQIESLAEIHIYTPSPNTKPTFELEEFTESKPWKRPTITLGFFAALFKSKRERNEQENRQRQQEDDELLKEWQTQKSEFEQEQQKRKQFIEKDIYISIPAKEAYLEENLQSIVWPRETMLSTELLDSGKRIFIDVDLPEIEDMPNKTATVPQRGYKLSVKDMSPTQVQRLYMAHVHGIGFRIIGETFSAIQDADEVVLSAFSQRSNKITGNINDEYLYSVRISRNKWGNINFANLKNLDVIESLSQFELRRDMSKTGVFKAIQPFELN
jgi:Protein of unknown function (DUF4236)